MSKTFEERLQALDKGLNTATWEGINLKEGYTPYDQNSNGVLQKVGKIGVLRGIIKGFSGKGYHDFATLPANCKVVNQQQCIVHGVNSAEKLAVLCITEPNHLTLTGFNFTPTATDAISICCTFVLA